MNKGILFILFFKNQTVIKPNKKNVDALGIITIVFSTSPFDY